LEEHPDLPPDGCERFLGERRDGARRRPRRRRRQGAAGRSCFQEDALPDPLTEDQRPPRRTSTSAEHGATAETFEEILTANERCGTHIARTAWSEESRSNVIEPATVAVVRVDGATSARRPLWQAMSAMKTAEEDGLADAAPEVAEVRY
jgi:hypothetical protein